MRIGNQEPRILVEPKYLYSDGEDVAELSAEYGLVYDPWQQTVINGMMGRDSHDRFTAMTVGLALPRQNGKNAVLEGRVVYGMTTMGEHIIWTAHEVKTARESFLRLAAYFDNPDLNPDLAEMVVPHGIRRTNGQEAIELCNGGEVRFSARSRGAARGFADVSLLILDEAQELTNEQLQAILSTMAASKRQRQLILLGTPPGPGCPGDVFGDTRLDALRGTDKRLAWYEWSVPDIPKKDATFEDVLPLCYDTNPAMGIRLTESFTEVEFNRLSLEGFARERLGWWASDTGTTLIDKGDWTACYNAEPPTEGKLAYGVKFSPDGDHVALVACRKPKEGNPHVELVHYESTRKGTSWLADWLVERKDKIAVVAIDGASNVDVLIAQMRENHFPRLGIAKVETKDYISAATRFYNAIKEHKVTHFNQEPLNDVAEATIKRPIGDKGGWGFSCRDDIDPAPIEAAAVAYWGVMTTKRDPEHKMRVK